MNTVKNPLGDKTVSYFSAYRGLAATNIESWKESEYGLPFTRFTAGARPATAAAALVAFGALAAFVALAFVAFFAGAFFLPGGVRVAIDLRTWEPGGA